MKLSPHLNLFEAVAQGVIEMPAGVARTARSSAWPRVFERAWSAITYTCIDAIDHLTGYTFVGREAILGTIDSIWHEHECHVAVFFVNDACTASEQSVDSRAIKDRSVA